MSPAKDPDHNQLEFQVENFGSIAEATEFLQSGAFASDPIGTEFDPEGLLSRMRAGEPAGVLKRRQEDRGSSTLQCQDVQRFGRGFGGQNSGT